MKFELNRRSFIGILMKRAVPSAPHTTQQLPNVCNVPHMGEIAMQDFE
jgi:hypothetical protein